MFLHRSSLFFPQGFSREAISVATLYLAREKKRSEVVRRLNVSAGSQKRAIHNLDSREILRRCVIDPNLCCRRDTEFTFIVVWQLINDE
jgi:hypothetical protein